MASKRPLSASSTPDSKLKGLTRKSSGENSVEANCPEIQSLQIQSIKGDPTRIQAMTVQELRTVLRDAGLPARGRKADLIFALKCLIDKPSNGESTQAEECLSSSAVDGTPVRRKIMDVVSFSHVLAVDTVSEASTFKKSKRVVGEEGYSGAKNVKVESDMITTGEAKSSIQTDNVSAEPWMVLAHKKPQKGWVPYNPKAMRPSPLSRDTKYVKLMSWNVNGLRALMKLGGFSALELAQREDFDVLCLQETKLQEKDVNAVQQSLIDGYKNSFWSCSFSTLGYSGTAIVSRVEPLSVTYGLGIPDHDSEGRIVTAEFDSFYLLNTYVPNSGDGLKRLSYRITQWDPALSNYMKELEKSKPVILTGDLNCAHQEIDIYNPAGNKRSAGFTDEERESFGTNFLSKGFVDTFRKQHPGVVGYTYWGYRHGGRKTNKGWRLDYFLVSESIVERVHDSYIAPEVTGSDHCPIGLVLKL